MYATKISSELYTKEVDRKEFILTLGVILLTLTGISGILKNLSNLLGNKQERGFGAGPYGK